MDILSAFLKGLTSCYLSTTNGWIWYQPSDGRRKAKWFSPDEVRKMQGR